MSAPDIKKSADSLNNLSPDQAQIKSKQMNHLSLDSRHTSSIPRTSTSENGARLPAGLSSQFSLELASSTPQDAEKIKEALASEMGVPTSAVFDDIKGVVTKLSNKIATAENAYANSSASISKLLGKLQKTIPALVTNEDAGNHNQELILQIYGMLIYLTSESNKLAVSLRPLDKAREQLNEKLGISELSVNITTSGVDGGATTAPTPATSQPLKLFAKLPKQIMDSGLEKPELMRLSAVYELIETEIDYVQDLKTMINFHRKEVANQMGDVDANLIFSNIDQLLNANQALANKMNVKREHNMFVSEVGDLLIDCAESFNVYSVYASNYPAAMKLLSRPEMKELLTKLMAAPDARGLSLESFLIKPVQRICKYPLLIRDLGKYTEKAGNVKDTELLRKAAEKIEEVVKAVNEATRAAEEKQRILGLGNQIESASPLMFEDKVYLKDGPILRIEKNGKAKERYVILYTDLILICTPVARQPPVRGPAKYELECGYSLAELTFSLNVKDLPSVKNLKTSNVFGLNVISEDKDVLLLMTNTDEEFKKWVDVFQHAFKDITEEHRSAVRSLEAQQKALDRQSSTPGTWTGSVGNSKGKVRVAGLSAIAAKRAAGRKSQFQGLGTDGAELLEPEVVKINGIVYKRALSVLGIPYYYNNKEKSAMWKLPANFQYPDDDAVSLDEVPSQQTPSRQATLATTNEADEMAAEKDDGLGLVEGFPNWRKVLREGDSPYYFHILTQETRWDPPTTQ